MPVDESFLAVAVVVGSLAVFVIPIAWLTVRAGKRLDAVGAQLAAYARHRGLEYLPLRGGYHFAPGLGGPPTIRGNVAGVEVEVVAVEARRDKGTRVRCASPSWLPDGSGVAITRREARGWFWGDPTPTGDPAFDAAFGLYVGPPEAAARIACAEVRRAALALAPFASFRQIVCFNAHGNHRTEVSFDEHAASEPELDAAIAALVAIHRS